MNPRSEFEKYKDQLALLLLLWKLKTLGFHTQRLKLQKLMYMSDIFGTILEKKTTNYTFQVYKHGPFSKEIFSDIERLVSVDAVKVREIEPWDPEQDRSFEYEIEQSKVEKMSMIEKISELESIEKPIELAVQAVGYLSGEDIRKLVYSEPNYIDAKIKGLEVINPSYELAVSFKQMSKRLSKEKFGITLNNEEVLWLFFNYVKETQKLKEASKLGHLHDGRE